MNAIALLYDDDAYVERLGPPSPAGPGPSGAIGLMGRQVAGRSFLDALLTHGRWERLAAVVLNDRSARTLSRYCHEHPSSARRARRLRVIHQARFLEEFLPDPPAPVLHIPCPPEERHAWARQHGGPHRFALSGVTHTLCSSGAVRLLSGLLTAPFEPYDALICTSRAVVRMVRAVTGSYADFLRDRHGGAPALGVRLEYIPLGVDPDRFRPPTPDERAAARQALGIGEDEVAILFVGRLSHHAKAHPYPLYAGASSAARATGRKVHLVLAGWTANDAIRSVFRDGAERFARGIRTSIVDGTDPANRVAVWRAADIFASPSDNIQETFGLSVVEAMAAGLPVVAADWDGYRDLVAEGETGLLVPTTMVQGSLDDATARLMIGAVDYDHFLAECSQAVAVDVPAMGQALARLVDDPALRAGLGEAGRRRALEHFTWERVVRAYEDLWSEQAAECEARRARAGPAPTGLGPALYPEPLRSFDGYPTRRLGPADRLVAAPGADLQVLIDAPLTAHSADHRATDPALLRAVLDDADQPRTLADLDDAFRRAGHSRLTARATVAWLLKYGLLRVQS